MPDAFTRATVPIDDPDAGVRVWSEEVTLPTYPHGEPLPHPMFLDKRVYQGSSGRVYPFPVIDVVGGERAERTYQAVFLENRWIKVMLLPELGGRVHMAYDKQHDHHFVYFNRVVKPALVGLTGPWISGGIEFNWPQHHRPSTFLAVAHHLEPAGEDGHAACVLAETDRMHGTRMVARFSLAPDHAALRVDVTLTNPTDQPQSFLWWANPAVAANDDYQSVFPPDVHAVLDHGKRDVSEFPIARGRYYKVDYSAGPEPVDGRGRGGTDISRYRNIPVPTSFMAFHSEFDFMGGYDHGRRMGLLHVADHHRVPGKKQWTWGHGAFGRAWDRELTDEDGPYVELMVGAYTDNQPDFSWLDPGEEKRFTQHFMPYREVGMVKNANTDLQVGLEPLTDGVVRVAVGASRQLGMLTVELRDVAGATLWTGDFEGRPGSALVESVAVGSVGIAQLRLAVRDAAGAELLAFQPDSWVELPVPEPAVAIPAPAELPTVEQCFLAGQHLEQYRHATREPADYYREGLERDPEDLRCNHALGVLLMRRGACAAAEPLLRAAIARQTERNGNPYDGEPHYSLGQCLVQLGRDLEAEASFRKAAWSGAFQGRGLAGAARAALRLGAPERALTLVDEALHVEPRSVLARSARLTSLLALAVDDESRRRAAKAAAAVLDRDPLDLLALFVRSRAGDAEAEGRLRSALGGEASRMLELALPLLQAGLPTAALAALRIDAVAERDAQLLYLQVAAHDAAGDAAAAEAGLRVAAGAEAGGCFPCRLEMIPVFERAMELADELGLSDGLAPYLLGNLLYDRRQHERAIRLWEGAVELHHAQPLAWRNLGLACFNQRRDPAAARRALETAFELAPDDARLLYEVDQLHKEIGVDPAARLARLEQHSELIEQRDDLYVEHVRLLNTLRQPAAALARIERRVFHPWEGGEGKVTGEYRAALLQLAAEQLAEGAPEAALGLLDRALIQPESLGEGRLAAQTDNDLHYWRGRCLRILGRAEDARAAFERATAGELGVGEAQYYNDMPPEWTFWAALAMREVGRDDAAEEIFRLFAEHAVAHQVDRPEIDYFAVSLPNFLVFEQDLAAASRRHCLLLTALSQLGCGEPAAGRATLDRLLAARPDEQVAVVLAKLTALAFPG